MLPLHAKARELYAKKENEFKHSANKGLLFDRFYSGYDHDFLDGKYSDTQELSALVGPCGVQEEIKRASQRLHALVSSLNGEFGIFKTDWHFVTGTGNSHPAENGFSWHHTLGTPYVPGSAVKGLLRAWIEEWGSDTEPTGASTENKVAEWFGSGAKGREETGKAGALIFFDALPIDRPTVLLDIMTPHMGKWYEEGANKHDAEYLPGDWHNPVPINFLVTSEARFVFAIAPRTPEAKEYAKEAMEHLKDALAWLGAGAKTAAGYGHMSYESEETMLRFKSDEERAVIEKERAEQALKEKLTEAGIEQGIESWSKALLSDAKPGSGEITISFDGDKLVANCYGELSEAAKKKLKRGRKVYVDVQVERLGNSLKLVSLKELDEA